MVACLSAGRSPSTFLGSAITRSAAGVVEYSRGAAVGGSSGRSRPCAQVPGELWTAGRRRRRRASETGRLAPGRVLGSVQRHQAAAASLFIQRRARGGRGRLTRDAAGQSAAHLVAGLTVPDQATSLRYRDIPNAGWCLSQRPLCSLAGLPGRPEFDRRRRRYCHQRTSVGSGSTTARTFATHQRLRRAPSSLPFHALYGRTRVAS